MSAHRRKVIQIMAIPAESGASGTQDLYALCSDGSIWVKDDMVTGTALWAQVDTTSLTTVKGTYDV